jgi:hypothetical protein
MINNVLEEKRKLEQTQADLQQKIATAQDKEAKQLGMIQARQAQERIKLEQTLTQRQREIQVRLQDQQYAADKAIERERRELQRKINEEERSLHQLLAELEITAAADKALIEAEKAKALTSSRRAQRRVEQAKRDQKAAATKTLEQLKTDPDSVLLEKRGCSICYDDVAFRDGIECLKQHFTCDDYFAGHVNERATAADQLSHSHEIACPVCDEFFSEKQVLDHILSNDVVLAAYGTLQKDLIAQQFTII